ncbi:Hypothetical protein UVM_LOCUS237, partial [uncultured virus]
VSANHRQERENEVLWRRQLHEIRHYVRAAQNRDLGAAGVALSMLDEIEEAACDDQAVEVLFEDARRRLVVSLRSLCDLFCGDALMAKHFLQQATDSGSSSARQSAVFLSMVVSVATDHQRRFTAYTAWSTHHLTWDQTRAIGAHLCGHRSLSQRPVLEERSFEESLPADASISAGCWAAATREVRDVACQTDARSDRRRLRNKCGEPSIAHTTPRQPLVNRRSEPV